MLFKALLHLLTVLCLAPPNNQMLPANPTSMALDGRFIKVFFSHQCSDTWACCRLLRDRVLFIIAVNHQKWPPQGARSGLPENILGPAISFACQDLEVDTDRRPGAIAIRYSFVLICDDDETAVIVNDEYIYISNRAGRDTLRYRGERGYCRRANPNSTNRLNGHMIPSWARQFFNPTTEYTDQGSVQSTDGTLTATGLVWGFHLLGRRPSNPTDHPYDHAQIQSTHAEWLNKGTGSWICEDTVGGAIKPVWQETLPTSIGVRS